MSTTATHSSEQVIALAKKYVIGNYTRYPVCLVRGEGSWVWDAEGNRYLDFFPGWGCGLLGHCPPRVVEAVQRAGRPAHPRPEHLVHRAAGAARRGARRADRLRRPVLLLQQRHRGERGGDQARPAQRQAEGPVQDRHDAQQLPRPDDGRADRDRPAEVPRRASSRCCRASATPRSATSTPSPRLIDAETVRHPGRADPGRGRHQPAAGRLPRRAARAVRPAQAAADLRRGADRHGPHRQVVRPPALGRRAGRRDAGQGAGRRRRAGRADRQAGGRREAQARHARGDVRRQPARLPGPPWPPSRRSRPTACWTGPCRSASGSARGSRR